MPKNIFNFEPRRTFLADYVRISSKETGKKHTKYCNKSPLLLRINVKNFAHKGIACIAGCDTV